MDFTKAFDVLDHDLLFPKLAVDCLSKHIFYCIVFYVDRRQIVHVNASTFDVHLSDMEFSKVLFLDLYSVYISDLPLFIKACCEFFAGLHKNAPPSLTTKISLNLLPTFCKAQKQIPRIHPLNSSLVYSGSVFWNSVPDSLRLPSITETFKPRYMSHVLR